MYGAKRQILCQIVDFHPKSQPLITKSQNPKLIIGKSQSQNPKLKTINPKNPSLKVLNPKNPYLKVLNPTSQDKAMPLHSSQARSKGIRNTENKMYVPTFFIFPTNFNQPQNIHTLFINPYTLSNSLLIFIFHTNYLKKSMENQNKKGFWMDDCRNQF